METLVQKRIWDMNNSEIQTAGLRGQYDVLRRIARFPEEIKAMKLAFKLERKEE